MYVDVFVKTPHLCPPFSEHEPLSDLEELWVLHELEVHGGLVARPEALGVHPDDGGGLADGAAVDHGLVPEDRGEGVFGGEGN